MIKIQNHKYIVDIYMFERIFFNSEQDNLSHPIFYFFFKLLKMEIRSLHTYLYHRILGTLLTKDRNRIDSIN